MEWTDFLRASSRDLENGTMKKKSPVQPLSQVPDSSPKPTASPARAVEKYDVVLDTITDSTQPIVSDIGFAFQIVRTHQAFLESDQFLTKLLNKFKAKYNTTDSADDKRKIQAKAASLLRKAFAQQLVDASQPVTLVVKDYLNFFQGMGLSEKSFLGNAVQTDDVGAVPRPPPLSRGLGSPASSPGSSARLVSSATSSALNVRGVKLSSLADCSAGEIAKHMCVRMMTMFRAVRPGEWFSRTKKTAGLSGGNYLSRLQAYGSELTRWAAGELMQQTDLKPRVATLTKLLELTQLLQSHSNFFGTCVLLDALSHPAVARLDQTWRALKTKHRTMWREMREQTQVYRTSAPLPKGGIASLRSPAIPPLAPLLAEVVAQEKVAETDLPRGIMQLGEVLMTIGRLQAPYSFIDDVPFLTDYFHPQSAARPSYSDEQLETLSKQLESAADADHSQVASNKDSRDFSKLVSMMLTYQKGKSTTEDSEALLDALLECSEDELRLCQSQESQQQGHQSKSFLPLPGLLQARQTHAHLSLNKLRPWHSQISCLIYETLVDTVRITNTGKQTFLWRLEQTHPLPSWCHFAAFPREGVLKKKEQIDVTFTLVFTQPGTVRNVFVLAAEGAPNHYLPMEITAEPITAKEREVDYEQVKSGEILGQGAAGTVYKCTWQDRVVAVKKFHAPNVDDASTMREWRTEVQLLSKLQHPNIVKLIGVCTQFPNLCIIMEFLEHGSLSGVLGSSVPLDWPLRFKFALDASKGLAFLHSVNVLHRDLKSANLLVSSMNPAEDTIKVTDFSLSRDDAQSMRVRSSTVSSSGLGTPHWKAPEMLAGRVFTVRSDVYSFGMVMWEIWSRTIPFNEIRFGNQVEIAVAEGKRPAFPPLEDNTVSADSLKEYQKLTERCWQADPERRPLTEEVVGVLAQLSQAARQPMSPEEDLVGGTTDPPLSPTTADRASGSRLVRGTSDGSKVVAPEPLNASGQWTSGKQRVTSVRIANTPPPAGTSPIFTSPLSGAASSATSNVSPRAVLVISDPNLAERVGRSKSTERKAPDADVITQLSPPHEKVTGPSPRKQANPHQPVPPVSLSSPRESEGGQRSPASRSPTSTSAPQPSAVTSGSALSTSSAAVPPLVQRSPAVSDAAQRNSGTGTITGTNSSTPTGSVGVTPLGSPRHSAPTVTPMAVKITVRFGASQTARFRLSSAATFEQLLVQAKKHFRLTDTSHLELQDTDGCILLLTDQIGEVFRSDQDVSVVLAEL